MQFFELFGRGGSNGRDAGAANVTHIMELAKEIFKQGGDAVWTGEHEPIVCVEFQQSVDHILTARGVLDLYSRDFEHLGTQLLQLPCKLACLFATSCNDDTLAKQWAPLKPIQFGPQLHHLADDGDRG